MEAGDLIWFRQTCRGGYGFQRDVPGAFVRAVRTRVIVLLHRKSGDPIEVAVHPKNVRLREAVSAPTEKP